MSKALRSVLDFWKSRRELPGWSETNFFMFALYTIRKMSPRLDLYDEIVDLLESGWKPEDGDGQ